MGNKRNKQRPEKRRFIKKQKHMIEIVNKRRRLTISSSANDVPSPKTFHELENIIPLAGTPHSNEILHPANVSGLEYEYITPPSQETRADEVTDDLSKLEVSPSHAPEEEICIGRRIINLSHFFKSLQKISNHGPLDCNLCHIDLVGEKVTGLSSKFTFLCRMCNLKFYIESDSSDENYLPVNDCAVAGIISIGGGHSNLQELSSALNLPVISNEKYQAIHEKLSKSWEQVAQDSMDLAVEKERNIAITKGSVSKNGIPVIDVIADGCYSKRSYKTKYSALSGAGTIIGRQTGEVLYYGVRNKYCYTCDRAEKKKLPVKEHKCFKNYSGSSTGMESVIIVEGFKKSVETHNLIYGRLISDGDSSTYNKILQARPYQNEGITVEKIECRNHLLRNFCNKLQQLQTDTKYPIVQRKLLNKNTILSIRSVIKKSITKNKNDECPDIQRLFEDIILAHHHAFGNHVQCKPYFCSKQGQQETSQKEFFSSSLWQRISLLVQNIAGHARSLIHDVDSNIVERYHSIIAKHVGGKRTNYSLKQSYSTRCTAATVAFNTNKSISRLYKNILNRSPRGKLRMLEDRRIKKKKLNCKYSKKKRRIIFTKPDENYGAECNKPDMPEDVLQKMKINFLSSLKKTEEEIKIIEKKTILQRDSSEWMELRRSLLTASNFGPVIKKRPTTGCVNLIKDILYKKNIDHVPSIKHGLQNEKKAILQLSRQENVIIEPCGLFIDEKLPFLGASPDGVCGGDTIVEIKCPITAHKLGLDEAILQKKINFWIKDKKGDLKINTNHNWYFQVQGQLHITKRKQCLFAVWVGEEVKLKTEIIQRDDLFWKEKMEEKLQKFYMLHLLPEIVDPRFTRNLPIRDNITSQEILHPPPAHTHNTCPTYTDIQQPTCSRYLTFTDL